MENSTNIHINNGDLNTSIEAIIKKMYKLKGRKIQEVKHNELIITEADCSLIEVDIVIDI